MAHLDTVFMTIYLRLKERLVLNLHGRWQDKSKHLFYTYDYRSYKKF